MKTDTKTLIKALRILANDIESNDGVANACVTEAADRLEEMYKQIDEMAEACHCGFCKGQALARLVWSNNDR